MEVPPLIILFIFYANDTLTVPPFAIVNLYLVPSGLFIIIPSPVSTNSTFGIYTVSFAVPVILLPPNTTVLFPLAVEPDEWINELAPLAVDDTPPACEYNPLAIVNLPSACDAVFDAVVPEPSACEPIKFAVVLTPSACEPIKVDKHWLNQKDHSPYTLEYTVDVKRKSGKQYEEHFVQGISKKEENLNCRTRTNLFPLFFCNFEMQHFYSKAKI